MRISGCQLFVVDARHVLERGRDCGEDVVGRVVLAVAGKGDVQSGRVDVDDRTVFQVDKIDEENENGQEDLG